MVFQSFKLFPRLTVLENISAVRGLLVRVELTDKVASFRLRHK